MSEPLYHCPNDPYDPESHWAPLCAEDVHGWFELTYASYLTLPRSLLQEMPAEWQHRFVRLLDEMGERFRSPLEGTYAVLLRGKRGRFINDPLRPYRYPSRHHIELATKEGA